MENKRKDTKNGTASSLRNSSGSIPIILVGLFVIFVIFVAAKGIFKSNVDEITQGLDTATINTDVTGKSDESAQTVNGDLSSSNIDSKSDSSSSETVSETDESSQLDEKMYITEYAYLHTQPANDAENIVCMSPGVEVTVLEYEENGYVKITFENIDGPLTGYIYKDYLASYNNQTVQQSETTAVQDWQTQTEASQETQAYWQAEDNGQTEAYNAQTDWQNYDGDNGQNQW